MHQETAASAEARRQARCSMVGQLVAPVAVVARGGLAPRQYVLLTCCLLHSIHDGFTSAMYLLLPLIATDLRLSY